MENQKKTKEIIDLGEAEKELGKFKITRRKIIEKAKTGKNPSWLKSSSDISRIKNQEDSDDEKKGEDKRKKCIEYVEYLLNSYRDYIFRNESGKIELTPAKKSEIQKKANLVTPISEFFAHEDFFRNKIKGYNSLKILDTWLHYLGTHHEGLIISMMENIKDKIQVLALYPLSDALQLRAENLGKSVYEAQRQSLESIELIIKTAIKLEQTHKVEIKWYDAVPSINSYILDDQIYFGQFFAKTYSSDAFFFQTAKNEDINYVYNDVIKHFDNLWEQGIIVNLEKIEKIKKLIGDKKSTIENLSSTYLVYNLDESVSELKFQVSALIINKLNARVSLIYQERGGDREKLSERRGKIQLVGSSNILFSIKDGNFFIDFLVPRVDPKQEILQSVYLHHDSGGLPKSAYALIVAADDSKYKDFITRDGDEIDDNIKNYLLRDRINVLKFRQKKNLISELGTVSSAAAIKTVQSLSATWLLYYPDRYPKNPISEIINPVGKGIFTIEPNLETGSYKATLKTADPFEVSGNVQAYETGDKGWFLNCTNMTDEKNSILLNILIKIGRKTNQTHYDGVYNIKYSNGATGCGFVEINKLPGSENFEKEMIHYTHDAFIKENINTNLFLSGVTSIVNTEKHSRKRTGVYYVYHVSKRHSNLYFTKSIMRIYKNQFVEFKGCAPHLIAHGQATFVFDNLLIQLYNISDPQQQNRIGYFILNQPDVELVTGNIFSGIFSGLSQLNYLPLSKKIIFEYCAPIEDNEAFNAFSPFHLNMNEDFSGKIDSEVLCALRGQFGNLVKKMPNLSTKNDLIRINNRQPNMEEIFLESAIYKVSKAPISPTNEDIKVIVDVLQMAWLHGLNNLDLFEAASRDFPAYPALVASSIYEQFAKHIN